MRKPENDREKIANRGKMRQIAAANRSKNVVKMGEFYYRGFSWYRFLLFSCVLSLLHPCYLLGSILNNLRVYYTLIYLASRKLPIFLISPLF